MAARAPDAEVGADVRRVIATAVDADFYRSNCPGLGDLDPIRHYLEHGWRAGHDPAPWFSASAYLAANEDVAQSGVEPLFHFLTVGRREGREAAPSEQAAAWLYADDGRAPAPAWSFRPPGAAEPLGPRAPTDAEAADRELLRTGFDPAFYLMANPDVAQADIDPLDHFMSSGWREGRDPSGAFSVREYLDTYPDVAEAGLNPFVHYLRTGRAEGRQPRNDLGFRFDILRRLTPMPARVKGVIERQAQIEPGAQEDLAAALVPRGRGLHLTFSHDDYARHLGGVQLCLRREAAGVGELGRDHLHLFPAAPWPVVRRGGEPAPLGVLWNGQPVGAFDAAAIAATLAGLARSGPVTYAAHSLLGHDPDEAADILQAAGAAEGDFWLHDFASLCAGFHLLRNDVEDCAAPPPDSASCRLCVYGEDWRARHVEGHRRFFERMAPAVVSPSQPTLDLWLARWPGPAPASARVHPHVRLVERGAARPTDPGRPFRLAYAGFPAAHKGWPLFRDLVRSHADDPRYVFLHLGRHTPGDLRLEFRETSVSEDRPHAMREALEQAEADAVLIWPLCRETFSLAAHEAVAAGAAVITSPHSGNVAAFVAEGGHGLVLPDEATLAEAFASGRILALARARRRPRLYDMAFSRLSADRAAGAGHA